MKVYCAAVVLAAGQGRRMGTKEAKQFLTIGGLPVVAHSLLVFEKSPRIDEIILVVPGNQSAYVRREIVEKYGLSKVSAVIQGGKERYESVWNALALLKEQSGDGYVFIHDGARPFISQDIIERAFAAAEACGASVVGMPVKDTIKVVDAEACILESPERSRLWQAQTPQVFRISLIGEAFRRQMGEDCKSITDDAMVVQRQMGVRARMVEGSYENIKITTPEDLAVAEAFLRKKIILGQSQSHN